MDVAIVMSVILSVICIIFMLGTIIGFIVALSKLLKLRSILGDREFERKKLEEENKRKAVAYTNDIMEFTRMMISQISILSFQKFKDGRDITKITEANIKHLVEDVARTVSESIAIENITMGNILITRDFFNKYIIETTVFTIKKMLNDALEEL